MSLADLVRRTGMAHATARRLTLELVEAGALERTSDNRFAVGLRLCRLDTLAPRAEALRSTAQPFVEDLYTALRTAGHPHSYVVTSRGAGNPARHTAG